MSPTKESSFAQAVPVWILSAEKKDDKNNGGPVERKGSFPFHTYDPYYNHLHQNPTPAKKDDHDKGKNDSKGTDNKKETTVVMKVDMCCNQCEETIKVAIGELKGVKSVECNWFSEKVTVVATTAAPADILIECRMHFKASRMWSDDD